MNGVCTTVSRKHTEHKPVLMDILMACFNSQLLFKRHVCPVCLYQRNPHTATQLHSEQWRCPLCSIQPCVNGWLCTLGRTSIAALQPMTAPLCSSQVLVNNNLCISTWHNYFERNWPRPQIVFRWSLNTNINEYTVNTPNCEG